MNGFEIIWYKSNGVELSIQVKWLCIKDYWVVGGCIDRYWVGPDNIF